MLKAFVRTVLRAAALVVAFRGAANAAVPSPAPAIVSSFNVGSLHVDQYSTGTMAVVFVPGLACGPWEWGGEIARLAKRYAVYALTLPGFDGQPPIEGPLFATATSDFWNLLDDKRIVKPVVIGHSLGGTMGFMLATQHPERLSGVISLDGLPIYPASAVMPPEQVQAAAAIAVASMAKMSNAEFEQSERTQVLPSLVTSHADVNAMAPLVAKSNPAATGRWLQEDLLLDLRPQLAKAAVPILLIAPYDASVDARFGAISSASKEAFYGQLVKAAPNIRIVTIDGSRHFAMYDRPQATAEAIEAFLSGLPPG